ncbi:hypothetical protein FRC02_004435 [Tulasnella sp. 418]|nr:hypothetical protein FRC02_004435 [Tulasnella sp. 418]
MLRLGSALLTPLRTRFEEAKTPRAETNASTIAQKSSDPSTLDNAPEDFARDARIEIMRRATEDLKSTETLEERGEGLSEILRMMIEDPSTRDVFRELDGFLILISILSGLRIHQSSAPEGSNSWDEIKQIVPPRDESRFARTEIMRLVFAVLSESIKSHTANKIVFENEVGYQAVVQTISSLIEIDSSTAYILFGYLTALAFHNFSLSSTFSELPAFNAGHTQPIDDLVNSVEPKFTTLHNPNAIISLASLCLPSTQSNLVYATLRVIEKIMLSSHRSQAILSSLGLGGVIDGFLNRFQTIQDPHVSVTLALGKRILKRSREMGAPIDEARSLFHSIVRMDDKKPTLNSVALGEARGALKWAGKWPPFISFGTDGRNEQTLTPSGTIASGLRYEALTMPAKAFSHGLTFSAWVYLENLSEGDGTSTITLLEIPSKSQPVISLRIHSAGHFLYYSEKATNVLDHVDKTWRFPLRRWTHVCLIHSPSHITAPAARIFVDGSLCATGTFSIPRINQSSITIFIGNSSNIKVGSSRSTRRRNHQSTPSTSFSVPHLIVSRPTWYLAASHLLSQAVPSEIPRLMYTLGPQYSGNFRDSLGKFLTYQSSTSLNIFLSNPPTDLSSIFKKPSSLVDAIKDGFPINEDDIILVVHPNKISSARIKKYLDEECIGSRESMYGQFIAANASEVLTSLRTRKAGVGRDVELTGDDILICLLESWEDAIWRMGGAAVLLRIIELASTEVDMSRSLSMLSDAIRTSWRNSEDMERIGGYEILMSILRPKALLLQEEGYEALLSLLGIDFRHPQNSTITNPIAYRTIVLDFPFWAATSLLVQRRYAEHFSLLLQTSRFRAFNCSKSRFGSFGIINRLIVVLQTATFKEELIPKLVEILAMVAREIWSAESTIKPIIRYLAANLNVDDHLTEGVQAATPSSIVINTLEKGVAHDRAEQVLEAFVNILTSSIHMNKFKSVLPLSRICLLLLGSNPTPVVASLVLALVNTVLIRDPSYARKLDYASVWDVFLSVLPGAWDPQVHVAAFDILLGRRTSEDQPQSTARTVACPQIFPAILAALDQGLRSLMNTPFMDHDSAQVDASSSKAEAMVDVLAEEMIDLHASSPTFRALFRSSRISTQFISLLQNFIFSISGSTELKHKSIRISEKLTHLGLMLMLDSAIEESQKEQLARILQLAKEGFSVVTEPTASSPTGSHKRNWSIMPPNIDKLSRDKSLAGSVRASTRSAARITAWRANLITVEKRRLRKALQDYREILRQSQWTSKWRDHLHIEDGLWPYNKYQLSWQLDDTEGPFRIRKRLIPESADSVVCHTTRVELSHEVKAPDEDNQSVVQMEVPPWADSGELVASDTDDDHRLSEEPCEDKQRRIRHELEPGDSIEDINTVTRIVGVDASPGLLILGKTHIYIIEGLVEGQDGEILNMRDAPKDVLSVPGSLLDVDHTQKPQRWHLSQVASSSPRMHLFRDVALEIYFKDGRNLLVAFLNRESRDGFTECLYQKRDKLGDLAGNIKGNRTPLFSRVARLTSPFFSGGDEISVAQRRWQARELSNYAYLSIINQASGRTPSDLTQYPVFPWILKDYDSEHLDLNDATVFRDLSTPMGALSVNKREAAETRYVNLQQIGEIPFHYGTHFSSSMIVSHFLIRLSPFSHYFKVLQGGNWDLPDRLFTDIKRSWESAAQDSRGDVRELIPDFFNCPEFLLNLSNLDFGTQTLSQEKVDSVKLPPWAKQDPFLFITLHRQALESDFVSRHLPSWIDLIWGYRQRDPTVLNVFHPLSYEGAIDLDSISNELEKEAAAGIIHNFGQTPRKLFRESHPPRSLEGKTTLPVGTLYGIPEDSHLILQSPRPVKVINSPVSQLGFDGDKIIACSESMVHIPHYPREHVEWYADGTLRLYIDNHVVQTIEDANVICCAIQGPLMVTGSADTMVRIWKIFRQASTTRVVQTSLMRGHAASVCCIAVSQAWSLIVSGSQDGTGALWDLNRAQYIRSIRHPTSLTVCAIQDSNGYIATVSKTILQIHTLNGQLIVSYNLTSEKVLSLAFHEREWSPTPILASGGPGGTITLWTWNADNTPSGQRARWKLIPHHRLSYRKADADVTALGFSGESLYSGDSTGSVYVWTLPEN